MKAYQDTADSFSQWCSNTFLELNVSKNKELVFDPRRGDHPIEPVNVNGQSVEVVDSFKYLGLTLDSMLSYQQHISHTQRKSQQRLYVLWATEIVSSSTRTSIESLPKYHRTNPYLLQHDLSFFSFSHRENKLLKITNMASNMSAFQFLLFLISPTLQLSARHVRSLLTRPTHSIMSSH